MQVEINGRLLTADSRPYDFLNDNQERITGTSHILRINIEGEIYAFKSTEEQVKELKTLEGKDITAKLVFASPKERMKVTVTEVEEA